jgi:hypothetical protein
VKKDIPRVEMVHHQDVTVELSTRNSLKYSNLAPMFLKLNRH